MNSFCDVVVPVAREPAARLRGGPPARLVALRWLYLVALVVGAAASGR